MTATPAAPPAARVPSRSISIGGTSYPLLLPNIRDPRLHVAAVILTVHALGQVALGFELSIPQLLAAMLTCAVIEVALTFRSSRMLVWPASAMLTGSGTALILRVIGTPAHEPWYTGDWWVFAGVAAFGLLTKYVIRYRGTHVFNPSNIGLVVAFLVLGSSRVEPLDFWWTPLELPMLLAYAVIIGGGLAITRRLKLLGMAAAFWVTLAAGLGVLATSGHCMVANWAFAPVCGFDYWRVIVTSPEVLIFLFFMITDPKTTPTGTVGRVVFGFLVGVVCVLLMAPQTDEFGTKVAVLSGLVLVCAARPLVDRLVPEPRSAADDLERYLTSAGPLPGGAARVGVAALAAVVLGGAVAVAGAPARGFVSADASAILDRLPEQIDPSTLPPITIAQDVTDWNHEIAGEGAAEVALDLVQNLAIENEAVRSGDASLLTAAAHGDRLVEMQERVAGGDRRLEHYRFDDMHLMLIVPFGVQSGLSLGVEATGTVTTETLDGSDAMTGTTTEPFSKTFVVRRATGDRWLNVAVLPETPTR